MYTTKNYPRKKALIEDFKAGRQIRVYQPGGVYPPEVANGTVPLEGPHYPAMHTWYATATIRDGVIIKVK